MPRSLSLFPAISLAFVILLIHRPAHTAPVVVPDSFPTVQAAIDAGAEVIWLRSWGLVPERITVDRSVTIESGIGLRWYLGTWIEAPTLISIESAGPCVSGEIRIRGIRFLAPIRLDLCEGRLIFEQCQFDSGLVAPNNPSIGVQTSVRNCVIMGEATVVSSYTQFLGNAVIGGTARLLSDGAHDIRNNYMIGPAGAGLDLSLAGSEGAIRGNTIRGTTDGIRIRTPPLGPGPTDNDIADCGGDGIVWDGPGVAGILCDSNRVTNCVGAGITIRDASGNSSARLIGNAIRHCGTGISLSSAVVVSARGNTVLNCAGDGFVAHVADDFQENVVGRNGGVGVRLHTVPSAMIRNTIFSNAGAGVQAEDGAWAPDVKNNIFAFNGGPGMAVGGNRPPFSSCNDWFANVGGPAVGIAPDGSDWFVDPLFCDANEGDVRLRPESPLLSAGFCGQVGAKATACSGGPDASFATSGRSHHVISMPEGALRGCCEPDTLIVPDGAPSVQAALDAGADVIQVKDGIPPEEITISHRVLIEPWSNGIWVSAPALRSVSIGQGQAGSWRPVTLRGIRILDPLAFSSFPIGSVMEACRFDSGMVDQHQQIAGEDSSIRYSMFIGGSELSRGSGQYVGNIVIGGTAKIGSDGSHEIRNNYIVGPAEVGLELRLSDSDGPISGNTIRNVGIGIRMQPSGGYHGFIGNDIADCGGDGIQFPATQANDFSVRCDSNRIERCGGAGIAVRGTPSEFAYLSGQVRGNVVRHVGQEGIFLPGVSLRNAIGNTVFDCGGTGFTAVVGWPFEHNVIGECGGDGVHLEWPGRTRHNTIFSNHGAGIRLNHVEYDTLSHNIVTSNGGPGLLVETGWDFSLHLACNNWFGNPGRGLLGIAPGASDVWLNPLFCDPGAGNVHLSSDSPMLNMDGCGLIGALGQGCVATTAVGSGPSLAVAAFQAWPVPARGRVTFALRTSTRPSEVEIFDIMGRRRWHSSLAAGVSRAVWDARDHRGNSVPPGIYLARLRQDGVEVAKTRVVLTH